MCIFYTLLEWWWITGKEDENSNKSFDKVQNGSIFFGILQMGLYLERKTGTNKSKRERVMVGMIDTEALGFLSGNAAREMLEKEGIVAPSVRILEHFFILEEPGDTKIWLQRQNFDHLIAEAKPLLKDGGFFEHPPARLMRQQQSA